jgi:hypothetical protein
VEDIQHQGTDRIVLIYLRVVPWTLCEALAPYLADSHWEIGISLAGCPSRCQ